MEDYIKEFLEENNIEYEIIEGKIYTKSDKQIDICPEEEDEIYLLCEKILELEARDLQQEETNEELSNYVLDLDARITNIENI